MVTASATAAWFEQLNDALPRNHSANGSALSGRSPFPSCGVGSVLDGLRIFAQRLGEPEEPWSALEMVVPMFRSKAATLAVERTGPGKFTEPANQMLSLAGPPTIAG